MIESEGLVVRVEGDSAYIQAQRKSSCGGCAKEGESCGTSTLIGFFDKKTPLYRARNDLGAKVGDRVVIGVEDGVLYQGMLAIYLPPLLLLLAGAIGGQSMAATPAAGEIYAMGGALAGLAAGFFWSRNYSARLSAGGRYQPVILSKVFVGAVVDFHEGGNKRC